LQLVRILNVRAKNSRDLPKTVPFFLYVLERYIHGALQPLCQRLSGWKF